MYKLCASYLQFTHNFAVFFQLEEQEMGNYPETSSSLCSHQSFVLIFGSTD